jgi:hypothetical protein
MKNEMRYFITNVVAIPVLRIAKKSDAYKQATKPSWGVVDTDSDGNLFCDEDSHAILINKYGQSNLIYPYETLNPKEFYKQIECQVIIQGDSCGFSFWEKEEGDVKFFVTYDENGFIDTYRLAYWAEKPYDNEVEIKFKELPITETI